MPSILQLKINFYIILLYSLLRQCATGVPIDLYAYRTSTIADPILGSKADDTEKSLN